MFQWASLNCPSNVTINNVFSRKGTAYCGRSRMLGTIISSTDLMRKIPTNEDVCQEIALLGNDASENGSSKYGRGEMVLPF
ncbi:MAG: hypothetical protein F6K09_03875 [Merismopedia sp. SIO2A8]|nr:hypothetical protein [Symploca sp. SIO2B6]NET47862.1 hypothetical protein [Merismopedia sp. SIO2A8]